MYATGVSTDLNGSALLLYIITKLTLITVTYLNSGGQVGDIIKAVATCDKFGSNLAYTSISFTNAKGELAARGSHTK
jgi:acyl-coenzyme A thioesterase 13